MAVALPVGAAVPLCLSPRAPEAALERVDRQLEPAGRAGAAGAGARSLCRRRAGGALDARAAPEHAFHSAAGFSAASSAAAARPSAGELAPPECREAPCKPCKSGPRVVNKETIAMISALPRRKITLGR